MIRLVRLSLVDFNGEVEHHDLDSAATEIIGGRNSGKTTLLRTIDYLFGDTDSAAKALGAEVADRYSALSLDLMLAGTSHQIERRPNDYGYAGKVFIDGEEMRADQFSDWILTELGWPIIKIPKAQNPKYASTTVSLSFRTLLRHIYRREDSWSDFAYKENELHRRAVLRYFLGILDVEADLGEFEAAQADREVLELTARVEEASESASFALQSVARRLGLDVTTWDEADNAMVVLREGVESIQEERLRTTAEIGALDGYNNELTLAYEALSNEIAATAEAVADIQATRRTYEESAGIVRGEVTRLGRANTAIDVFADVPVKACPACGQDVTHKTAEPGCCFLCELPVTEDNRKRRVELEIRALSDEEAELVEQIERTDTELAAVTERMRRAQSQRDTVAAEITEQRSALLAPYVVRLEQLSAEQAKHEQAIATLTGLRVVLDNVDALRKKVETARARLTKIEQANIEREENAELVAARCDRFANWMNEFLAGLEVEPWRFGPVVLRPEDMEFVVKGRPWREHLGGETKVSFFLAYHYALLKLSTLDAPDVRAPGLAILDNPIQQGVPDAAVTEGLQALEDCAAATGGSVVSAFARSLGTSLEGKKVDRMTHVYGSDEEQPEQTGDQEPGTLFTED